MENGTREFEFCTNTDWNRRDYKEKVSLFGDVVDIYLAFLLLAGKIIPGLAGSYVYYFCWGVMFENIGTLFLRL